MKNKVIVVAGPTAVGKTALGIKLAQEFNGEIINGDSQQVYKGLDIGTAKASKEEQEQAPHHLLDTKEITENFSAHDFVAEANILIEDIISRGKLPIIVGGTGLYLQSLIEGYHLGGSDNHEAMRKRRVELEDLSDEELEKLFNSYNLFVQEPNRRRLIREIEKFELGSDLENQESPYEFMLVGLNMDRQTLYDRINLRVDIMTNIGILEEAEMLYKKFPDVQATRAIGYKEYFPYFDGHIDLEEATETVKKNTRHYAKRQITWFKNRMNIDFYDVLDNEFPNNVLRDVDEFLNKEDRN
ncbi:tRNA (adenosine(37)-N6)-dimethylallyltransferase MiaA [Floricoccus tropicus]|uniref:tRNA dimethylallyltransferase n=1 Tax=Floricoccus tropicus TaxID=1859473 RepID=A0A1E8GJ67_9LACT|nr:tRNA (adenosine(37)-N6)-dimethylallyltransferase MiaA [Floricoccus tropicus]OFI48310.1 tRNA (adenosine(37)-N6)-dimethylallyltransferase MiaA [Floricoccus tropicus]